MNPLEAVDAYLDAVPRRGCRVENLGPLRLFVPRFVGSPWYARPVAPDVEVTEEDVRAVARRQDQLGMPVSFEWVAGRPPAMAAAVVAAGLEVREHLLLVAAAGGLGPTPEPTGDGAVEVRRLGRGDDVSRTDAVARVAFDGVDPRAGLEALDRQVAPVPAAAAARRAQVLAGRPVVAAAFVDGSPVARAACTREGAVAEVTGVATLPAYRGRGLASAVTHLLAREAFEDGAELVFLSADGAAPARVYRGLGFEVAGHCCVAGVRR